MKKYIIGITVVVIILLIGTGYAYLSVINSVEDLLDQFSKLEKEVKAKKWKEAKQTAETLRDNWEQIEDIWTPLLDHNRVSELENSITKLVELVKLESKTEALTELALSKRLVQNVPNTEKVNLKNIF